MDLEQGVLVGSDQTQEWLLPWWWEHYTCHNSYPVAFIDLGLSFEMKSWCKKHGTLIPLRLPDFAKEKEELDPLFVAALEESSGKGLWKYRNAWFKKPFACALSPFKKTVWIDSDCEIRASLSSLFKYRFALARDFFETSSPLYNTGVIVFEKELPLLKIWKEEALCQTHLFRDDQELLSALMRRLSLIPEELSCLDNWSRCRGENPEARIFHYHCDYGKNLIKQRIWIKNLSNN